MDNEPYRDLTHAEAADEVAAQFQGRGWESKREFWLPSGKVADVFILTPDRDLVIVEVKSFYKPSYLNLAFEKYAAWCHSLWLAIPGLTVRPQDTIPGVGHWQHGPQRIGIIGVDRNLMTILSFAGRREVEPIRYAELYSLFCQD